MSRGKLLIRGSLVRAAYGAAALAFPQYIFGAVGIKEPDPDARYVNRLFGGRDLLVAGQTVIAVASGNGKSAVAANLFAEATDTVALVEEIRLRRKLDRVLIVGIVFNAFGYLTWLRALLAGSGQSTAGTEVAADSSSD
jgi:hypothetical protein